MSIRVLDAPDVFPKYDVNTLSNLYPVVDLGVDLEYHSGAVFITQAHGLAVGEALGMFQKEYVEALQEANAKLQAHIDLLEGRESELHERIAAIFAGYRSADSDYRPSVEVDESESGNGNAPAGEPSGEGKADPIEVGTGKSPADGGNAVGGSKGTPTAGNRPAKSAGSKVAGSVPGNAGGKPAFKGIG